MTDQEEFDRARKRLYALADRMGMKLTIIVRRKPVATPAPPTKSPREPGEE